MTRADPLADRFHLAYISYLVLGMGTLFPWCTFITAADYFEAQYPGRHADRLFTVCYLPVNLAVLAALIRHHSRVRPLVRVVGGFAGFTLAVSAVPLLDAAGAGGDAAFGVILSLVALCGVCDGLAQGALFGDAAGLPPRFTQALISGTGVSGVVVCLLRVLTKATLPGTPEGLRASASAYFALAAVVCASCVVLYWAVVPRLPLIRYYRQAALEAALQEAVEWGGAASPGKAAAGQRQWQEEEEEEEDEECSDVKEEGARLKAGRSSAVNPSCSGGSSPRRSSVRQGGGPHDAAAAAAAAGSGRAASPELLTDMMEAEPLAPAPSAQRAQRSRRSSDVELVPEDHYDEHLVRRGGHVAAAGMLPTLPSPMQQALLDPLSSSYYSVAEEGEEGQGGGGPSSGPAQQHADDSWQGPHSAAAGAAGEGSLWAGSWRGRAAEQAGRGEGGGGSKGPLAPPAAAGTATGVVPLDYRGVLRQLWRFAAANVAIYTVTLSIFPGVLAEDVSSERLGSWYPVVLITAFNIADWAGKSAPGLEVLRLHNERAILWAAVARVLFIPAFHLAATGGAGPGVIGLLTVLLGVSNGYLTSCAMIGAPARVSPSAAELAGNLMVLSLIAGLCIGAACGFLWLL